MPRDHARLRTQIGNYAALPMGCCGSVRPVVILPDDVPNTELSPQAWPKIFYQLSLLWIEFVQAGNRCPDSTRSRYEM